MSKAHVHLVVGTPCYGGLITTIYATSLLRLQQACLRNGIDFGAMMLGGDALVTRARQNLVSHFLGNPAATHLLFIDADIGFAPEQVFRLLEFNVAMCAALYPTKRPGADGAVNPGALSYVVEVDRRNELTLRDGFVKVSYAGTGFLMMQRDALLSMIERYPELRYKSEHQADDPLAGSPWRSALFNCIIDESSGTYLSEDFSFCRRWTDMGGEIWADGASQLTHSGAFAFNGNFQPIFDNLS